MRYVLNLPLRVLVHVLVPVFRYCCRFVPKAWAHWARALGYRGTMLFGIAVLFM